MAESIMEMAEEHFQAGKIRQAYDLSKYAWHLDPYLAIFHKYHAAFRIHVLAKKYDKEPNWYKILELPYSANSDTFAHAFCLVGKLVAPENNNSAAAKKAYKLAIEAFEVLSDDDKRKAFRRRLGITEPDKSKEEKSKPPTPLSASNVKVSSRVVANSHRLWSRRTRYQPYHDHRSHLKPQRRIGA